LLDDRSVPMADDDDVPRSVSERVSDDMLDDSGIIFTVHYL